MRLPIHHPAEEVIPWLTDSQDSGDFIINMAQAVLPPDKEEAAIALIPLDITDSKEINEGDVGVWAGLASKTLPIRFRMKLLALLTSVSSIWARLFLKGQHLDKVGNTH